ncbi:MAG: ATP-binding cassette domain-containing protein [Candidatus Cryptobacteroides sp.]
MMMNNEGNAIEITNLSKYYGKARGVEDVSFNVRNGDFFGFIGPNGAGKSTTIRVLMGLIRKTSGEARIFGLDVWKDKPRTLTDVGYLPSEVAFYPGQTVSDVLSLSARLHSTSCGNGTDLLCERLKLDKSQKVSDLSLGNRKKVGIVAALQHNPRLVILDEPTSGLDPLMQHEFFEILKERNDAGTTIFLSSHILSEVQTWCRRAAIIREGRLVACDDVDNLLKSKAKSITTKGGFAPEELEGCSNIERRGDSVHFLYNGDTKTLLRRLSEAEIDDVSIGEPNLEDIFMHFYK